MCYPQDNDGYTIVGDFRVSENAHLLPRHRVCQVCRDDRAVLAPATHLGPMREDLNDEESRIIYMPVCASHAASWLLGCEGMELGPMMRCPVADLDEGKR